MPLTFQNWTNRNLWTAWKKPLCHCIDFVWVKPQLTSLFSCRAPSQAAGKHMGCTIWVSAQNADSCVIPCVQMVLQPTVPASVFTESQVIKQNSVELYASKQLRVILEIKWPTLIFPKLGNVLRGNFNKNTLLRVFVYFHITCLVLFLRTV